MNKEDFIKKFGEEIKSDDWSLGGEQWGYSGDRYSVSGEEPCNFDKLDEILEELVPNITYLQYKKLYNACVEAKQYTDNDYYSCIEKAYYICNAEELYEKLEELGLL